MRSSIVVIFAMLSCPAFAQDAGPKPQAQSATCFDIALPPANAAPYGPILINRCTGATWLLSRERAMDAHGKPTSMFVYRWHHLADVGAEAILAFPNPSKLPETPAPAIKPSQ